MVGNQEYGINNMANMATAINTAFLLIADIFMPSGMLTEVGG